MKYLGKFTGKLYSLEEKHDGLILECALQLSDAEAKDEEYCPNAEREIDSIV